MDELLLYYYYSHVLDKCTDYVLCDFYYLNEPARVINEPSWPSGALRY